jgi:UDP-2-acetamido-3-amino-2,3-dideoxy-glucuronate N-acetyltransferase
MPITCVSSIRILSTSTAALPATRRGLGPFVEVQIGAKIGARCKISSHTFTCEGVTIEDEVFIGHGVMFINDKYPRATTAEGRPQGGTDWTVEPTRIGRGASIGSNATICAA